MLKKIFVSLIFCLSSASYAFDLEDNATTYRATRDAYLKAANEMKLATGPYKAAREAYRQVAFSYTKSLTNGKTELDQSKIAGSNLDVMAKLYND